MFSINNFRLGAITPVDYRLGSVPIQRMYLEQICVFDRTPAEKTVYTFEPEIDALAVTATAPGNPYVVEFSSYRETYIDDVPQGDKVRVPFKGNWQEQFPDWCSTSVLYTSSNEIWSIAFTFDENTTTSSRQKTTTIYQQESGKSLQFTLDQGAGTITTQYTLNVQPTEDTLTGADDDNSTTFTVNTYKQQVINGTVQSAKTHVTCNFDSHNVNESAVVLNSTNNNNGTYTGTVTCNMSSTNKDYPITITQSESNKTATFILHKVDPTIAYGDITITSFTYPKLASAAGETLTPTVTYSQTYGYNGATTGGGTITSGATVTYSGTFVDASTGKIIIPNKGTTVSGETTVSEVTVHVSMNGKTASETFTVKQEANTVTYGEVTGGTATANDILASGGTVQATVIKDATQTVSYTSGSTRSGNITTSATEVSASSLGTTTKDRTQVGTSVLTFTGEGGKTQKVNVAVYQQANSKTAGDIDYGTWQVSVSANPTTITAGGGTSTITRSANRTRVQNYSYTSGATSQESLSNETGTPTLSITGSGFSLNNTTVTASSNIPAKSYTLSVTSPSADLEDGPAHNLSSTVTSTYSIAGTNSRNCTVTANMNGTVKTCTVTQSGNTASSGNQDWSVAKGTGLNSATKSGSTVVMTPTPQYGDKNQTFTGQCTVTQTGSNKTATATGTWYKGYLNVSPTSLQFDANGGTKTVNIDTNLYWEIVP